tara:strand:- start:74 stop:247 length:174 start_codon:yes stop_codon:yes gene_type:complete
MSNENENERISETKIAAYCALCRREEIELYDEITDDEERHIFACELAGCLHPAFYTD